MKPRSAESFSETKLPAAFSFSLRLSARRRRSCLFPSPPCSHVQNILPEPDGQKTADSMFILKSSLQSKHLVARSHSSSSLCVSAWAVMMERRQQRLQLVLLPPALFVPVNQDVVKRQESLEALGDTVHPFIIYQETCDIWINVTPGTYLFKGVVYNPAENSAAFNGKSTL